TGANAARRAPLSGASTVGMTRQQKAAKVEEVSALVAKAHTIVVAEYRGLDVESVTKLRKQARGEGVQLRVLKNTLARRAVSGTAFAGLSDKLVGPLMYGFSADPVAAAKVLAGFAKDNDKLVLKAGAMPDFVMDEAGVKSLATMPSREELLAKLMATMQAPIGQFVRTLNEVPARLVRTLAAVRDAKEQAPA
ncbi:MAG TPA: 50S ribosomal protein L10, partial [Afifellaceae bacterium]|nr:50S ribosomal protein L10 [Afifellaceae bacterium]